MSENPEEKQQEGGEEKKSSKMLPILLGVILVVGAAIGTVAFVLPPKETEEVIVPIADFDPVTYPEKWSVRWNVRSLMGQVEFKFVYKTRDPLWAEQQIAKQADVLRSNVLLYLSDRSADDVGGPRGLQLSLRQVVERALFPDNKDIAIEDEKPAMVTDILILNYLPPGRR